MLYVRGAAVATPFTFAARSPIYGSCGSDEFLSSFCAWLRWPPQQS